MQGLRVEAATRKLAHDRRGPSVCMSHLALNRGEELVDGRRVCGATGGLDDLLDVGGGAGAAAEEGEEVRCELLHSAQSEGGEGGGGGRGSACVSQRPRFDKEPSKREEAASFDKP